MTDELNELVQYTKTQHRDFSTFSLATSMMKLAPMSVHTLYFRDGILSMPGYTFNKVSFFEINCQSLLTCKFNRPVHGTIQEE